MASTRVAESEGENLQRQEQQDRIRQIEEKHIVLLTEGTKPKASKDKHREFLKAVVTGRVARLFLHLCVFGECMSTSAKSGVPSPRNISKIATANQTECKSALWKEL